MGSTSNSITGHIQTVSGKHLMTLQTLTGKLI
jgi:hypothetical protein